MVCGTLWLVGSWFPDQGWNLGPPAVRAPGPNHWRAREFPNCFKFYSSGTFNSFTVFRNQHRYLVPELFHYPRRKSLTS